MPGFRNLILSRNRLFDQRVIMLVLGLSVCMYPRLFYIIPETGDILKWVCNTIRKLISSTDKYVHFKRHKKSSLALSIRYQWCGAPTSVFRRYGIFLKLTTLFTASVDYYLIVTNIYDTRFIYPQTTQGMQIKRQWQARELLHRPASKAYVQTLEPVKYLANSSEHDICTSHDSILRPLAAILTFRIILSILSYRFLKRILWVYFQNIGGFNDNRSNVIWLLNHVLNFSY